MKLYHIHQTIFLPISLDYAWSFFSSPHNLSKITPAKLNFKILYVSGGEEVYAGQIIRYKLKVLPLITLNWVTEITQVQQPNLFVDEQRFGPYAFWHHQHHFKEVEGGIEMTDDLHYGLPFGFFGRLAHWIYVGKEVANIFDYRTSVLKGYFLK